MNGYLRQSTASQTRTIGPFVGDTDFKTLQNALTIANTDIKIKKNGGASASKNSGGATADGAGGLYAVTWDATDTATVGELYFAAFVAGALVVFGSYVVLEEAAYDALYVASAPGYVVDQPVNATKFGGTSVTGRDLGASVLLSPGTGTGQIDLTSGIPKANMTQILGTAVSTPATAGILDVNVKNLNNVSGAPITTVKAVQGLATDGVIPTATNLTNAPTNGDFTATMKTSIGTAVAASAVASVTGAVASVTGNVGGNVVGSVASVVGAVGSVTGAVGSLTTNNDKTGYTLSNTGMDNILDRAAGVETNFTLRQALRLILSSAVAKLSGAATTTIAIRDINDTKDRITATVDSSGNRSAITTDVT